MNTTNDNRAKSSFGKLVITFFYLLIYPVLLFLLADEATLEIAGKGETL